MKEHLRKVTHDKTSVHYLAKNIQNELISLLVTSI